MRQADVDEACEASGVAARGSTCERKGHERGVVIMTWPRLRCGCGRVIENAMGDASWDGTMTEACCRVESRWRGEQRGSTLRDRARSWRAELEDRRGGAKSRGVAAQERWPKREGSGMKMV
jgi:hypothetical protein